MLNDVGDNAGLGEAPQRPADILNCCTANIYFPFLYLLLLIVIT